MSIQQQAIGELGEILIDNVFDYMQKNQDRFNHIPLEQQAEIISIALTGANISIATTMKERVIQ